MLLGENEQLNVLGRPLHESEIGLFDVPDSIAAVIVTFPDSPKGTVTESGDALKDMVAGMGGGVGVGGGVGTGAVLGQLGL